LWILTWILVVIGLAAILRRIAALLAPAVAASPTGLDANFASHSTLTMLHIVPALAFLLVGPFQFRRELRARRPSLHRWMGRMYLGAAAVIGISALVMSPQMAIGGALETAATTTFALLFLFSLARAFLWIRRRKIALHREWMIRAWAIGLAVTTTRPIVGAFFATSRFTHLTPHDFFGIAFWLGFTLHLPAAETWIRRTRSHPNHASLIP
jgi:uncharacterized membrane protein